MTDASVVVFHRIFVLTLYGCFDRIIELSLKIVTNGEVSKWS